MKQKRSILKKVLHKIHNQYNVSIAELDYHDLWQRTRLGIAVVTNDYVQGEKVLNRCLETIDTFTELERTVTNIERL